MKAAALTSCVALTLTLGCGSSPPDHPAAATPTRTSSASPSELRIPSSSGPPVALAPGTYLTPTGFSPELSVTVPAGWYGGGGYDAFGIGQGDDEAHERFADCGLQVDRVQMDLATAAALFRGITSLHAGRGAATTLAGHPALRFRTHVTARHVVLDPLNIDADIGRGSSVQYLVDLGDDESLLVRTEVFRPSAAATLREVVASIRQTG